MDELFSEQERFLISKWREGVDLRHYEQHIKEVAASGESLTVCSGNAFVRMVIYEVAHYWNLTVRAFVVKTFQSDGPWNKSRQLKMIQSELFWAPFSSSNLLCSSCFPS